MKKLVIFCLMIGFSILQMIPSNAGNVRSDKEKTSVLYFHYTRRCLTCQAVETEAKNALQTLLPEQFISGEVEIQSINLDESESETLAQKWDVSGQTLLVVKGDHKIDLTSKAFMFARTNPEKYHQLIKEAINEL